MAGVSQRKFRSAPLNTYTDEFLSALGAWQRGWKEDKTKRRTVTEALVKAIAPLKGALPLSQPLPICYRKRFLVPNNAQNGGDIVPLILDGRIDEGIAAWTADPTLHQQFKEMARPGNVTTLFAHRPRAEEVLADLSALWGDEAFVQAVEDYASRSSENTDALLNFKDQQRELVLDTPLLREEVIGFVGVVSDDSILFEKMGADTDERQDAVFQALKAIDVFPGDARWLGRVGAQRAIARTRAKWLRRLSASHFRQQLCATTNLTPPATI